MVNSDMYVFAKNAVKRRNLELELVDWGIAFRTSNSVVLNKALFQHPGYFKKVLDHELRHTGKFKMKDFLMDLLEGDLLENLNFCIKHPKGFLHFIPFSFHKGVLYIDANQIINLVIIISFVGVLFWLT